MIDIIDLDDDLETLYRTMNLIQHYGKTECDEGSPRGRAIRLGETKGWLKVIDKIEIIKSSFSHPKRHAYIIELTEEGIIRTEFYKL